MKKFEFIFSISIVCFVACEPPVTFDEPQPADTKNLAGFPNRMQGKYLSLDDQSVLEITEYEILRIYDFEHQIHVNQLNEHARLSADTIIDIKTNEKWLTKRNGDSLIFPIHFVDTLFHVSSENVLKKFKGYYFLNFLYDKDRWEVRKMQLSKGQLTISEISTQLELEKLAEITESTYDTVPPHQFSATKKEFKEFVKSGGFTDAEIFIRLKKGEIPLNKIANE